MTISQLCWNVALLPEDERNQMLSEMRSSLQMDDDQFDEFRRSIIEPMIRRHQEMFPTNAPTAFEDRFAIPPLAVGARQEWPARRCLPWNPAVCPVPCKSGRKYKFCCKTKA